MSSPFDYVKDASHDKKNLMRGTENDALAEESYSPWLTNIAFSYHLDSVLPSNQMNIFHEIPNYTQYLYYINTLRPKKRFAKWVKKEGGEDLELICQHYQCNYNVGKQYLNLLSSEQLQYIRQQQEQGGIDNEFSGRTSSS